MKHRPTLRILALLAAVAGLLTGCGGGEALPETGSAVLPVTDTLNVYCFQAGKADAFLFWNSAGAILIDTGESGFGKVITAKLAELGIEKLDCLILTHFDKDHVGGAKKILETVLVSRVLQSNSPKTGASAYEKYVAALAALSLEPETVTADLTLTLGDAVFAVNPPAQETYEEDPSNNSSLIVTVTHGANRLLFTGDAEDARLSEFLETEPASCVLVKLPHHGQWHAALRQLLQKTCPRYAVITSSREEPEDEATLDLLAQLGIRPLLTRDGPLKLISDGENLEVLPG